MDVGRLGSSFNCARPSSVGEFVCANTSLRRTDLLQLQAYYTLRHAIPSNVALFRQEYLDGLKRAEDACSMANLQDRVAVDRCIHDALLGMARSWNQRISQSRNPAALEEQAIDLDRMLALQTSLRNAGYLPPSMATDGIFGTGTRAAIMEFQRANGISPSGFMTRATADRLISPQAAAPRRPTQTPAVPRPRAGSPSFRADGDMMAMGIIAMVIGAIGTLMFRPPKVEGRCPKCGKAPTFNVTGSHRQAEDIEMRWEGGPVQYETGTNTIARRCSSCGYTEEEKLA